MILILGKCLSGDASGGGASNSLAGVRNAEDASGGGVPGLLTAPPGFGDGSLMNAQINKLGSNVDFLYQHAQQYAERHSGYLQNLEARLMAGDQRITQAFELLTPAVQTLDTKMGVMEAHVGQAMQNMQTQTASAFQSVEQRIMSHEQQFGQVLQSIRDAINQLQASQSQLAASMSGIAQTSTAHSQQRTPVVASGAGDTSA